MRVNKIFRLTVLLAISLLISQLTYSQKKTSKTHFLLEGIKQYNIENYQEAENLFLRAIAADSENNAAYFYLGNVYFHLGSSSAAKEYYQIAAEKDTNNYWYQYRLAQYYESAKNIVSATDIYAKLLNKFPEKANIYYPLMQNYAQLSKFDKAEEVLDKLEKQVGKNEQTENIRFEILRMEGDNTRASKQLILLSKSYPTPRVLFMLGELYKSLRKDSLAVNSYQEALKIQSTFAPANLELAEIYRHKRKYSDYFTNINIYLKDHNMDPGLKATYLTDIVIKPEFLPVFKPQVDTMIINYLTTHPNDSTTLSTCGSYYLQAGQLKAGITLYLRNLKNNPENYQSHLDFIGLLYYLQNWEETITYSKKALERFPNDMDLLQILSISYWQAENYNNAIINYEKMISLLTSKNYTKDDKNKMLLATYASLGDIYHQINKKSKSYKYYNKALKINPKYVTVLNNYAYFLCLDHRQLKKAYRMSKITVLEEPDNPTYLDTYGWILYRLKQYEEARQTFKHAMLYGGNENANILNHYGDVLYALKDYDLAFIYWDKANIKDPNLGIKEKLNRCKKLLNNK
ncbi:MAG: tetratricopeptide repeat protein [Bacteroidales bacterium]